MPMKSCSILLRHGEMQWQADLRHSDPPLNDAGPPTDRPDRIDAWANAQKASAKLI